LDWPIVIAIIVIVLFVVLFFVSWARIERSGAPLLRPLLPLSRLRRLVQETVESGAKVHFSIGNGGLEGQNGTAESLSGLTALSTVESVAARTKGRVTATSNDAMAYLISDSTAYSEYNTAGRAYDYKTAETRFVTQQQNIAYAAGVSSILKEPNVTGNAIIGRVGPEYLLVGDVANRRNIPQIAGTTQAEGMPLMIASAGKDNVLLGEEVYAAPAYLSRNPAQLASLRTQDIMRLIIIAVILVGIVLATLGLNVGNLFVR
jgi:hypothetical protein